jgi:divalent metal cation (Fe/Co/Zn/Cd) transporter
LSDKLKKTITERFSNEIINVKSVLVRPTGMAMHAEVHVEIDGRKRFGDVDLLLIDIEMVIRSKFPILASLTIIPHSSHEYHCYPQQNDEIQQSMTKEITNQ